MMNYKYGEDISYKFSLLEEDDLKKLSDFDCNNSVLNTNIYNEIKDDEKEGVYYKFYDIKLQKIIALVSLAANGIVHTVGGYTHVLPAIKIDILAVDKSYQKMHFNVESEEGEDHFYFSDQLLAYVIDLCREIRNTKILADYIVLYADVNAIKYYKRNGFEGFHESMLGESNQQISQNIPMYMDISD